MRLAETARWVMPVRYRVAMLKSVKRTKGPAPRPPNRDERARTAAIMVVVVSTVITVMIVASIHLLRRDYLLVGVSGIFHQ